MSIKIETKGVSRSEQRQLQEVINKLGGDIAVDGAVGPKSIAALEKVAAENNIQLEDGATIEDITQVLQDAVDQKALEADAGKPVSDASKDNVKRVQELLSKLDPKIKADGIYGPKTEAALNEFSSNTPPGIGIDLATASIEDVIANLESQVEQLPERYVVENCDTLSEVALEVYGDDIKELTQQLLDAGKFASNNRAGAEQYAIQMAYTKLAFANGKENGTDANKLLLGEVLEIPESGPLSEVIADPKMRLDVEALDADRTEGGPCGCDEVKTPFTNVSTPPGHTPVPTIVPNQPGDIQLGEDCVAEYEGEKRGLFGLGKLKDTWTLKGTSGENAHDLRQELGRDDIRTWQNCQPEPEGGGDNPGPDAPGPADSAGGGSLGGGPSGGPSTGLN